MTKTTEEVISHIDVFSPYLVQLERMFVHGIESFELTNDDHWVSILHDMEQIGLVWSKPISGRMREYNLTEAGKIAMSVRKL